MESFITKWSIGPYKLLKMDCYSEKKKRKGKGKNKQTNKETIICVLALLDGRAIKIVGSCDKKIELP